MKIEIIIDGKIYTTVESPNITIEKAAESLYENFAELNKLQLNLEDGSVLIIGKGVIQSSVFIVKP